MSEWVRSGKNKSFGRNNKIKHYFYLICLLASLLPAHARPISDMKSQPGLFVSSIPCEIPSWNWIPWKSMDIYGNPRNSTEIDGNPWKSMEIDGIPWMEYPWSSIECHGVPWSIHGLPWNAMDLFHEVLMEFHGMPWNFMYFPWRSMEFQGTS